MNGYEKEVKRVLKNNGWSFIRSGKGSHEYWGKGRKSVTVSHTMNSRHTANSVMKAAGINHKF